MENEIVLSIVLLLGAFCAYKIVTINRKMNRNRERFKRLMKEQKLMDGKKASELLLEVTQEKNLIIELKSGQRIATISRTSSGDYQWHHVVRGIRKNKTRQDMLDWLRLVNPEIAIFKYE